ncbi:MAG: class I SAM-dependent methyltransferase [Chlamydiales bacterium]|nr:class I SAM-dependent methyltransferase [Chlamydiales bacterium]
MTSIVSERKASTSQSLEQQTVDLPSTSREKMVSLLVQARILQAPSDSTQLLPALKSDQSQVASITQLLAKFFGSASALPRHPRYLVADYLSDEEVDLLALYLNMPRAINFKDRVVLKEYFAPQFRAPDHLTKAGALAAGFYQTPKRLIAQPKYGSAFPMHPEILAYAMELARGETVLEIAGAAGENSAILAFSEAVRVYLNDICPEEIAEFEKIRKFLPLKAGKKLESIGGSCFDLLKLKPALANKVGLLLCRNVIHFFNGKLREEFFALLKKVLRPGARAIFTANAVYHDAQMREQLKRAPDVTSFCFEQGVITDRNHTTLELFYYGIESCSEDLVSHNFEGQVLYSRELGSKWQVDNEAFNKLDKALRPKIIKAFGEYRKALNEVPEGYVKAVRSWHALFSTRTLPELFRRHGFHVEFTFVTSQKGHLIHETSDEELFDLTERLTKEGSSDHAPQLVGVIVKYPDGT